MKRLFTCGVVAVALALPANASAWRASYSSGLSADPTGTARVTFDVVKRPARKRKAKAFSAHDIPAKCQTNNYLLRFRAKGAVRVIKNHFNVEATVATGGHATWAGKLTDHGASVKGTVMFDGRAKVDASGTYETCHTGELAFAGGQTG